MKKHKLKTNSGFIALMSAIIISVVLLLIVTNLSLSGFYSRANVLDFELEERSSALAEACADKAIFNIAQGIDFTGGVVVDATTTPPTLCQIEDVSNSGGRYTIYTKGEFSQTGPEKAVTNLKVIIDQNDLSIISWEEIPNYPI